MPIIWAIGIFFMLFEDLKRPSHVLPLSAILFQAGCALKNTKLSPVRRFGLAMCRPMWSADVQLLESKGLKIQELRKAQDIAEEYAETIRRKWHEFFG